MWPFKHKKDNRDLTPDEAADVIERFLSKDPLSRHEWVVFKDRTQRDKEVDVYRRRCDEEDWRFALNPPDPYAIAEFRLMVDELRALQIRRLAGSLNKNH